MMLAQPPDASLEAPLLELTPADAQRGLVPQRQAAASEQHGPVLRSNVPVGPDAGPCVALVGAKMAEAVLFSQRQAFSSDLGWRDVLGRGCGQAIINTDDPLHVEQRRMWAPAVGPGMLGTHEQGIGRYIRTHLERWADSATIDAYAEVRALAFDVVAGTIAGLEAAAIKPAYKAITGILDGQDYTRESRDDYVQRANVCRAELADILTHAIVDRRRHRRATPQSLLDVLLDHPTLANDDAELRSHLTILLIAGHDTGATLYSRALHLLAQMPDVANLLFAELHAAGCTAANPLPAYELDALPRLEHFMLEVGRLYPALINLPRYVSEEIVLGGYRLAPGTRVAVAVGATHQLPSVHADPGRFDLDRYADPASAERARPYQWLAFSGGSRLCAGIRFAQIEFKAIVSRVLSRFELAADAEPAIPHGGFWNGRATGPLMMRVTSR